jgi:hypothetical protein
MLDNKSIKNKIFLLKILLKNKLFKIINIPNLCIIKLKTLMIINIEKYQLLYPITGNAIIPKKLIVNLKKLECIRIC